MSTPSPQAIRAAEAINNKWSWDVSLDEIAAIIDREMSDPPAEQPTKTWAEQLRAERHRLELTKKGAAFVLGISERSYHFWESDDPKGKPLGVAQEGAIERLRKIPNASAAFQQAKGAEY